MCGIIGVVGSTDTLDDAARGPRATGVPRLRLRRDRPRARRRDLAGSHGRRAPNRSRPRSASARSRRRASPRASATLVGPPTVRPETVNAHPHLDCSGNVAIIHNGIIENHAELQEALEERGHLFSSVDRLRGARAPHRGVARLRASNSSRRVRQSLLVVRGAFAVAAMDATEPDVIVAARRISPLIVGTALGRDLPRE